VFGLSLVTNLAAGVTGQRLDHHEVLEAGRAPPPVWVLRGLVAPRVATPGQRVYPGSPRRRRRARAGLGSRAPHHLAPLVRPTRSPHQPSWTDRAERQGKSAVTASGIATISTTYVGKTVSPSG